MSPQFKLTPLNQAMAHEYGINWSANNKAPPTPQEIQEIHFNVMKCSQLDT